MPRLRKRLVTEEHGDADAADPLGAEVRAVERALAEAVAGALGAGLRFRSAALKRRLARALGRNGDG